MKRRSFFKTTAGGALMTSMGLGLIVPRTYASSGDPWLNGPGSATICFSWINKAWATSGSGWKSGNASLRSYIDDQHGVDGPCKRTLDEANRRAGSHNKLTTAQLDKLKEKCCKK